MIIIFMFTYQQVHIAYNNNTYWNNKIKCQLMVRPTKVGIHFLIGYANIEVDPIVSQQQANTYRPIDYIPFNSTTALSTYMFILFHLYLLIVLPFTTSEVQNVVGVLCCALSAWSQYLSCTLCNHLPTTVMVTLLREKNMVILNIWKGY